MMRDTPSMTIAQREVGTLLACLEVAADDAEREQLLTAASLAVLDSLRALLAYRKDCADYAREDDRLAAFTAQLVTCESDGARLELIRVQPSAFVSTWVRRAQLEKLTGKDLFRYYTQLVA
jgi:hypothetical protein